MIEIAICDDNIKFCGNLEIMLLHILEKEHIKANIDVFLSGFELIHCINTTKKKYDLIFLDIEMDQLSGLDTARKIRESDEIVKLIYVTSYANYAIEAYEVQPFQFLLKPVSMELLHKYFMKAYEKISSAPLLFTFKSNKEIHRLITNNIMFFMSKKRVVSIYTDNGKIIHYYDKLNHIEKILNSSKCNFWRIHQSYLVNTRYICMISYDQIQLTTGQILYISEERREKINHLYCDSIGESF